MFVSYRSLALGILLIATGAFISSLFYTQKNQPPIADSAQTWIIPTAQAAITPSSSNAMPTLAPMLSKVTPAVVNIYTKQRAGSSNSLADYFGGGRIPQERISQSLGSGVIIDATRGLILTNNHVVEGADEVSVSLADGRTFEAQPIGSDPDTDIAVIRIAAKDLTALPVADSTKLRIKV